MSSPAVTVSLIGEKPAVLDVSEDTFMVDVRLQGTAVEPSEDKRPPLDLVLSLDESISMCGEKLKVAQLAAEFCVLQLRPCDRFGLVGFAIKSRVVCPLLHMDEAGRCSALEAIRSTRGRSSTNLADGLVSALELQLQGAATSPKGSVRAVLLFTDGQANVGLTKVDEIVGAMKRVHLPSEVPEEGPAGEDAECGASKTATSAATPELPPCTVHTFGCGDDHDAILLRRIAEETGGQFYFLESRDDVPTAFADTLGGLSTTIAQSLSLEIAVLDPSVSIAEVHTNYANSAKTPGKVHTVTFRDLQSCERRDVLLELHCGRAGTASAAPSPILRATLSYSETASSAVVTSAAELSLARPSKLSEEQLNSKVPAEMAEQWCRFIAAKAMEHAARDAKDGQFAAAVEELEQAMRAVKLASQAASAHSYAEGLVQDLNDAKRNVKTNQDFKSGGEARIQSACSEMYQQRTNSSATRSMKAANMTATRTKMRNFGSAYVESNMSNTTSARFSSFSSVASSGSSSSDTGSPSRKPRFQSESDYSSLVRVAKRNNSKDDSV